jgi:hypothetical protein
MASLLNTARCTVFAGFVAQLQEMFVGDIADIHLVERAMRDRDQLLRRVDRYGRRIVAPGPASVSAASRR